MPDDVPPVPSAALELWRELAGDPEVGTPGTRKVVRGSRGLGPPGWTAVLRLGDAWAIEAGDADDATLAVLLDLDDPADPDQVAAAVQPTDTRGPGELAYLPTAEPAAAVESARMPEHASAEVEVGEVVGGDLAGWLATLPSDDVEESSVRNMSTLLVADAAGQHVAAAGHLTWPTGIAHVGLLVAPAARGKGYGQVLGAAATRRAIAQGLTPQWRATMTNQASRVIATRIGYVEVGRQYSFRVRPTSGAEAP